MRRKQSELKQQMLEILEAAGNGFELLLATKRYQRVLAHEGLPGIRRILAEKRSRVMATRIYALKRSGLIRERRTGNRVRVALTPDGRLRLLRLRIASSPRLRTSEAIFVAFDFPISQGSARNSFRHLLRTSGFEKIQQSLWRIRRDVRKPMHDLIARTGARAWVRLLRTVDG